MTERIPAEAFPIGDFIHEELEARGWSHTKLALVMGCSAQDVSELISGDRAISREIADLLGTAFGTSAAYWLNLDRSYWLWRGKQTGRE